MNNEIEDNRDSHTCTKLWGYDEAPNLAWCPECGAIFRKYTDIIVKSVPEWSKRDKLNA